MYVIIENSKYCILCGIIWNRTKRARRSTPLMSSVYRIVIEDL